MQTLICKSVGGNLLRVIAFDPGKSGVAVCLDCETPTGMYYKLIYNKGGHLNAQDLYRFLVAASADLFVMEKVQGRGGHNATATFNFGFSCGELNALLKFYAEQNSIGMRYITPQAWQKTIHVGISPKLKPKVRSNLAYKQLYPHEPVPRGIMGGKPDDNVIDALLIATYGVLSFGSGGLKPWRLEAFKEG